MAAKKKAKNKAKKATKAKKAKSRVKSKSRAKSKPSPRKKAARARTTRSRQAPPRPKAERSRSTEPTGDLIGVSTAEQADSESVDELLDEGNTFEAGVVSGVERADDSDEREVRTREFPEDDVPEEYLDKD